MPDLRGHTVLVLHAHPDDEAIFTGLALRCLADAGARTVLVMATGGELGQSRVPLRSGEALAHRRRAELDRAAGLLGVARLVMLGCHDSGLSGAAGALARAEPLVLARRVAEIADAEGAATIVHDDDGGIYGHPDHRAVHRIGALAATLVGATAYRATVDRDHLGRVAEGPVASRHLVATAARAAAVPYGRTAAEIALTITGSAADLASKRAAITAHASQVGAADVPEPGFAAAYGAEWFRRHGPPGLLDHLGSPPAAVHTAPSPAASP